MIRNEDEGGQAEVVWTCHEERPRVFRKTMEMELLRKRKRGRPEKIFNCSERRYRGSWCKGDRC